MLILWLFQVISKLKRLCRIKIDTVSSKYGNMVGYIRVEIPSG